MTRAKPSILAVATLLLAGCDRPASPPGNSSVSATSPAIADGKLLQGRWKVVSIDGSAITGIELSSDGTRIWWEPACAGQGRQFVITRQTFKADPPAPLREVCDIGLPQDLDRVFAAIDAATAVARDDAGMVALSGGAPLLLAPIGPLPTVQKPAAGADPDSSRSNAEAFPAPATLSGEWKVVAIDGKDFNESYGLALSADSSEIWWNPRCAGVVRSYAIAGHALTVSAARRAGSAPKPEDPPPPVCAIGLPDRLREVVTALDAATEVRRTPSNGIELSGGGHSLLLFSQ